MTIEWVNNGKNFELPKITAGMDIEILTYMETLDKDVNSTMKNIYEFRETVFKVLNQVDKNVTKEMIMGNLTVNELGTLYIVMRQQGKTKCVCPYCKKHFIFDDMPAEGDTPLSEKRTNDTIVTKKGN